MLIIRIGSIMQLNKIYPTNQKPKLNKTRYVVLNSLILVNKKIPLKRKYITSLNKKKGEELSKVKIEDLSILSLTPSSHLRFHHLQESLTFSRRMDMMS